MYLFVKHQKMQAHLILRYCDLILPKTTTPVPQNVHLSSWYKAEPRWDRSHGHSVAYFLILCFLLSTLSCVVSEVYLPIVIFFTCLCYLLLHWHNIIQNLCCERDMGGCIVVKLCFWRMLKKVLYKKRLYFFVVCLCSKTKYM